MNLQLTTEKFNFRSSSAFKSSNAFRNHKTFFITFSNPTNTEQTSTWQSEFAVTSRWKKQVSPFLQRSPLPIGSNWMKRVIIWCSLQPTLPHGAPPAPEWLCCPVVQHYSEPNTEHLIWHWSLDGSSTCTTNLSIKMSSDWPLWEPLSNAVIYKYIKHTYHCATSFYQWAHWFLISS